MRINRSKYRILEEEDEETYDDILFTHFDERIFSVRNRTQNGRLNEFNNIYKDR